MKIVFANKTEDVSADSSLSGFPASNMLEKHSKKRWRAGSDSALISAALGDGSNALALCNVFADHAQVTVGGETHNIQLLRDDGWGSYRLSAFYVSYGPVSGAHEASIALSITGDQVSCGVLYSGTAMQFSSPSWGAGAGFKSHSIVYDLDNGFEYVFQRNNSDIPNFVLKMRSKDEFFNFKRLAKDSYPNPILVKIDDFDERMVYYARMQSEPKTVLSKPQNYQVSFQLKEFL